MGNQASQKDRQNALIDCQQASQSTPQQIMKVYLVKKEDKVFFVTVSPHAVEQYDQDGNQHKDIYKSKARILTAAAKKIQTKGKYLDTLILATSDSQIIILNKLNLLVLKVVTYYFYEKDLMFNLNSDIKISTENNQLKLPKVDCIYAQEFDFESLRRYEQKVTNNIYVGLQNGFIMKMMLTFSTMNQLECGLELEGQVMTIFNPLQFRNLEGNMINYENLYLPGLIDIFKCDQQGYLISVHRKNDLSFQNQPFEMDSASVYIYNEQTGKSIFAIDQIKSSILSAKVMQNRGYLLLLCGTNQLYVYSYIKNEMIQQLDFNPFITSEQIKKAFKTLDLLEYPANFQNQAIERYYRQFETKNPKKMNLEGDLIFFSTEDGDIMIAKLFYPENREGVDKENKIGFQPEKIFSICKKGSKLKMVYQIQYYHDSLIMGLSDAKIMVYYDILHHYYSSKLEAKVQENQAQSSEEAKKEEKTEQK